MDKVVLKATPRTVIGKQVRALRRAGQLPAIIYGHNVEPTNISLEAHAASLILAKLSSSSLVTIDVEGKEYPCLVREKQRHNVRGTLVHVDFQAVSLTEKIRANVAIVLTGLSLAVKDYNAMLINGLTELEVEAFPQDLPERITVDIAAMKKVGDGVYMRDIVFSDKVQVLDHPEEMIVLATSASKEEVETVAAEGAVEGAEPEVIEKGKKEEEGEE